MFCNGEFSRRLRQGEQPVNCLDPCRLRRRIAATRYFVLLSSDLRPIAPQDFEDLNSHCDSLGQLINALGRSLRGKLKDAGGPRVANHKSLVT